MFALLSSAVVVGQSYFLSLDLRQVLGFSPLKTGLTLVPITVVGWQLPRCRTWDPRHCGRLRWLIRRRHGGCKTGIPRERTGLASAVLNTAHQVGGAIGLAVLVGPAASRTARSLDAKRSGVEALTAGFDLAFIEAATIAAAATITALLLIPRPTVNDDPETT